jgi:hypothetical protein
MITAALMMVTTVAYAADIDIAVERLKSNYGVTKAILKVKNHLPNRVTGVLVECAFLDKDRRAIDIGRNVIKEIDDSSWAYTDATIATDETAKFVDCRVTNYR